MELHSKGLEGDGDQPCVLRAVPLGLMEASLSWAVRAEAVSDTFLVPKDSRHRGKRGNIGVTRD